MTLTYHGKPENILPYPVLEVNLKDEENKVFAAQAKIKVTEILPYFEKHNLPLNDELKKAVNKHKKFLLLQEKKKKREANKK